MKQNCMTLIELVVCVATFSIPVSAKEGATKNEWQRINPDVVYLREPRYAQINNQTAAWTAASLASSGPARLMVSMPKSATLRCMVDRRMGGLQAQRASSTSSKLGEAASARVRAPRVRGSQDLRACCHRACCHGTACNGTVLRYLKFLRLRII